MTDNRQKLIEKVFSLQDENGLWELERKMSNMVVSIGQVNQPNQFVTERANEVLKGYGN